jgi:hypothetical protein
VPAKSSSRGPIAAETANDGKELSDEEFLPTSKLRLILMEGLVNELPPRENLPALDRVDRFGEEKSSNELLVLDILTTDSTPTIPKLAITLQSPFALLLMHSFLVHMMLNCG